MPVELPTVFPIIWGFFFGKGKNWLTEADKMVLYFWLLFARLCKCRTAQMTLNGALLLRKKATKRESKSKFLLKNPHLISHQPSINLCWRKPQRRDQPHAEKGWYMMQNTSNITQISLLFAWWVLTTCRGYEQNGQVIFIQIVQNYSYQVQEEKSLKSALEEDLLCGKQMALLSVSVSRHLFPSLDINMYKIR